MRTITTKVYQLAELSEEMQEKAISNLYDINVSYDWWQVEYEDAATIGLKITSFDLDRNRHAEGKFTTSADNVAENIFREHGKDCETYKTAQSFMHDKYKSIEYFGEREELEADFLKSLLEDYSMILQKQSEYLQSDEAIKDIIEANEYEFTVDGKLINTL